MDEHMPKRTSRDRDTAHFDKKPLWQRPKDNGASAKISEGGQLPTPALDKPTSYTAIAKLLVIIGIIAAAIGLLAFFGAKNPIGALISIAGILVIAVGATVDLLSDINRQIYRMRTGRDSSH